MILNIARQHRTYMFQAVANPLFNTSRCASVPLHCLRATVQRVRWEAGGDETGGHDVSELRTNLRARRVPSSFLMLVIVRIVVRDVLASDIAARKL